MEQHPAHFVAVVGGAVAGSVAAANLAERGVLVAVFEQGVRPYGKIEDGLPKWHVKLRAQEERKIDERLAHPNIFFVPKTRLGRDLDFLDLVQNWGFSAVLLANGAWRDRPLPVDGAEKYIGKGLVYQNDLVRWFNHCHEPDYAGPRYDIPDNAVVVGGGLASLDVVKIVMLVTVQRALQEAGVQVDLLTLEHKSIQTVLAEHDLTLEKLGLKGCTLFYRRRVRDMPLAVMPEDATPERREKVYQAREKILRNFRQKYLFGFEPCRVPSGLLVENDRLVGLKFKHTRVEDGKVRVLDDTEYEARSPLVISSIGSIPEPIPGIDMTGELYRLRDHETGQLAGFEHVFALGNVVTGKGNIKSSLVHGKQVASHVLEEFLAWRQEDYEKLLKFAGERAEARVDRVAELLQEKKLLSVERIREILDRVQQRQKEVGYEGDYRKWIERHRLPKMG